MPDNKTVVETAMALRGAAPREWDSFLQAVRTYAMEVQSDFVRSAPELLQRSQGMAWQAQEIATLLNDAPRLYDQYQNTALRRARVPPQPGLNSHV